VPKANALVSLSVVSILCLTPNPVTDYKIVGKVETKKSQTCVKGKLMLLPIINWLG